MTDFKETTYTIRRARPEDYDSLGRMTVDVYETLDGMPDRTEQSDYYAMLFNVAGRAEVPTTEIWVAEGQNKKLLGGVTFIGDVAHYGSGGTVSTNKNCAGIRLLAVSSVSRNLGVGRALTQTCIDRASEIGASQVLLHTTKAMAVAWRLYEKMGFSRSEDLDFMQEKLKVYGFRLPLERNAISTKEAFK